MDTAETFEQLALRLSVEHPGAGIGHVEALIVEEHELLLGERAGDIVPPAVIDAVVERLEREAARGARPAVTASEDPGGTAGVDGDAAACSGQA